VSEREIYLPIITDEMFEMFNETCLMEWSKELNKPSWTQISVEFLAVLLTKEHGE